MAAKKLKCAKCGIEVESYSYGDYCSNCAEEVWDSGFESTSEHAYEIGFHDLVQKLNDGGRRAEKAVGEILGEWGPLTWKCSECGKTIIAKEESLQISLEEKLKLLTTRCECGGVIEPVPPDTFFH